MLSLEGRQLGNYDVIRRIRSGGMGAVYEGRQRTAFGRRVAIKVILGDYAEEPEMRRRFAREARTIARLHHPHILPLIEFGDEQGVLYLVMPFIEGGTLSGYLRRHLPDLHEVASIFQQVLDAVEHAHEEGLVHRDIKSSNVLLEARRSGPPYAYLADFGLVRTIQQAELDRVHMGEAIPLDQVPGTPHYMAPEQTWGVVTPATDIYALGVLLYQLLTGELPYNDPDDIEVIKLHLHAPVPNPCAADASIPAELGAVVTRAMAKEAEQRFPNISAFRQALNLALDGPAAHLDDEAFSPDSAEDFEVYELPPRAPQPPRDPLPPPSPLPPLKALRPSQQLPPLRPTQQPPSQRVSQQLPPLRQALPAPIEFREADVPATPRRPRTTDDHPAQRVRITEEPGVDTTDSIDQPIINEPNEQPAPAVHSRDAARPRPNARLVKTNRLRRQSRPHPLLPTGLTLALVLVLLLTGARLLNVPILPVGFPVFGASPVATLTLTVQTREIHDTFLLTAAPQIAQANLTTRVLPAHSASATVSGSQNAATTGQHSTPGTPASGTLLFSNRSNAPVNVANGTSFTAANGIQVMLEHAVVVPARVGGTNGTVSAPGQTVGVGQNTNLAANALNAACCGSGVTVSNPAAFSGGSDVHVTHLVVQSDLDGVRAALTPDLERQALQHIDAQLAPGEVRGGTPTYTFTVTSNHPVGSEATQVSVTVSISASALVYSTRTASDLVSQLLSGEAAQTLGASYQLRGGLNIAPPVVEPQGADGRLYLSVAATGVWAYKVTAGQEQQWRQAIKGASLTLAQTYLSTRPGITAAHIALPFGTDHLPVDEQQIVFVIAGG